MEGEGEAEVEGTSGFFAEEGEEDFGLGGGSG